MKAWLKDRIGFVRVAQLADQLRHRLSFVPLLYVIAAVVVVQLTLLGDRSVWGDSLPVVLSTTVDSARSVFSAMAGGLITSITLLMSMMLVAIQLASSQFSPRTLRDWLGDRVLQHAIGLVLGTSVYCLMALRSIRDADADEGELVPHVTVLVAVLLGVVALVLVVRSADHLTNSLRISSVARRIAEETIATIRATDGLRSAQQPTMAPASAHSDPESLSDLVVPDDAVAVEAPAAGWLQQLDLDAITRALPERSSGYVVATLGGYVNEHSPLLWISPPPSDDDPCWHDALGGFAIGDTRTLQQDVAFGITQLTDIAKRALSPGINDPETARDITVHLGNVAQAVWEQEARCGRIEHDGRTLVSQEFRHATLLHHTFEPIRRTAGDDPTVVITLVRTVLLVRSESERRGLPGPTAPLDEFVTETARLVDTSKWSRFDVDEFLRLVRRVRPETERIDLTDGIDQTDQTDGQDASRRRVMSDS